MPVGIAGGKRGGGGLGGGGEGEGGGGLGDGGGRFGGEGGRSGSSGGAAGGGCEEQWPQTVGKSCATWPCAWASLRPSLDLSHSMRAPQLRSPDASVTIASRSHGDGAAGGV